MLQVLQKLLEKLTGEELSVPEVTQSEEGQRNKLKYNFTFLILLKRFYLSYNRG